MAGASLRLNVTRIKVSSVELYLKLPFYAYPGLVPALVNNWCFTCHFLQAEIDFLGRLSHPNLVKLIGYCLEEKELLLVYEFMQKGSLEHHLFGSNARSVEIT